MQEQCKRNEIPLRRQGKKIHNLTHKYHANIDCTVAQKHGLSYLESNKISPVPRHPANHGDFCNPYA